MSVKLEAPKIRAIYENAAGELAEVVIMATVKDMTRYELEAARRGWPEPAKANNLYIGYLVHQALMRSEDCPPELVTNNFDRFLDKLINLQPYADEAEAVQSLE